MTRSCSKQAVWSKRSTLDYIEMNWVEFSWVWRIVRCIDPPPSSWKTFSIPLLRMKAEALSHRTPAVQYMSTYMFVENYVGVQRKRYDGTDQQAVITQSVSHSVSHSVYQSVSTSVSQLSIFQDHVHMWTQLDCVHRHTSFPFHSYYSGITEDDISRYYTSHSQCFTVAA